MTFLYAQAYDEGSGAALEVIGYVLGAEQAFFN